MAEQIDDWSTGRGAELEEAALGIPHQHTTTLERATNAFGQPLDERLELTFSRRRDAPEHRWLGPDEIRAVEHEHVEVDI